MFGKAVRIRYCPATVSDRSQGPAIATASKGGKAPQPRSQVRRPVLAADVRRLFRGEGEFTCGFSLLARACVPALIYSHQLNPLRRRNSGPGLLWFYSFRLCNAPARLLRFAARSKIRREPSFQTPR